MKRIVIVGGLGLALLASPTALNLPALAQAQQHFAQAAPPPTRNQTASNRDLVRRIHQVDSLLADLKKDQHDYGGLKQHAMQDLEAARDDMVKAVEYARAHAE